MDFTWTIYFVFLVTLLENTENTSYNLIIVDFSFLNGVCHIAILAQAHATDKRLLKGTASECFGTYVWCMSEYVH